MYRRLPVLALNPRPTQDDPAAKADTESIKSREPTTTTTPTTANGHTSQKVSAFAVWSNRLRLRLRGEAQNWRTFAAHPIFFSSLSISLLYLTVLSFDGSMVAYLKSHNYPDPFVAGMRGVGVVTGLMGTLVMPQLEKRIGLVRTGTWSVL